MFKHDSFEKWSRKNSWPKRSTHRAKFVVGFKALDLLAPEWRPRPFSCQKGTENQKRIIPLISHSQSIDNNILAFHIEF